MARTTSGVDRFAAHLGWIDGTLAVLLFRVIRRPGPAYPELVRTL